MTTITIWTQAYRPFMMGGNVHAGIKTQVEAEGPFDLGKGYQGYLLTAPWGETFVAEAQSGGLIGPDLETVRADVKEADPEVMKGQIEWALKELKGCTAEAPAKFWAMIRKSNPPKEPAGAPRQGEFGYG